MDTQDKKDDDSWMSGVELGHLSIEKTLSVKKTGKNDTLSQGAASSVNFKFKMNEVGIEDHGAVKTVGEIFGKSGGKSGGKSVEKKSHYQKRPPY